MSRAPIQKLRDDLQQLAKFSVIGKAEFYSTHSHSIHLPINFSRYLASATEDQKTSEIDLEFANDLGTIYPYEGARSYVRIPDKPYKQSIEEFIDREISAVAKSKLLMQKYDGRLTLDLIKLIKDTWEYASTYVMLIPLLSKHDEILEDHPLLKKIEEWEDHYPDLKSVLKEMYKAQAEAMSMAFEPTLQDLSFSAKRVKEQGYDAINNLEELAPDYVKMCQVFSEEFKRTTDYDDLITHFFTLFHLVLQQTAYLDISVSQGFCALAFGTDAFIERLKSMLSNVENRKSVELAIIINMMGKYLKVIKNNILIERCDVVHKDFEKVGSLFHPDAEEVSVYIYNREKEFYDDINRPENWRNKKFQTIIYSKKLSAICQSASVKELSSQNKYVSGTVNRIIDFLPAEEIALFGLTEVDLSTAVMRKNEVLLYPEGTKVRKEHLSYHLSEMVYKGKKIELKVSDEYSRSVPGITPFELDLFIDQTSEVTAIELFSALRESLSKQHHFREDSDLDFLCVWIMSTYFFPLFQSFPILLLQGAEGINTSPILQSLEKFSFNGLHLSMAKPESLYKVIDERRPTLCLLTSNEDEIYGKTFNKLLASPSQTSQAKALFGRGEYNTYCPICFGLNTTTASKNEISRDNVRIHLAKPSSIDAEKVSAENWPVRMRIAALLIWKRLHEEYKIQSKVPGAVENNSPILALAKVIQSLGEKGLAQKVFNVIDRSHALRTAELQETPEAACIEFLLNHKTLWNTEDEVVVLPSNKLIDGIKRACSRTQRSNVTTHSVPEVLSAIGVKYTRGKKKKHHLGTRSESNAVQSFIVDKNELRAALVNHGKELGMKDLD